MFDHTGQLLSQEDALLFDKWDVVEIVDQVSHDWWIGKRGTSHQGLLPAAYVEMLPAPTHTVLAEYDFEAQAEGQLSLQRGDCVVVVDEKVSCEFCC